MRRPPMAPAFYFIIDVSIASIQNKFLYAVIESIKDIINTNALNNYDRTKVAIVTYDTNIHFYNLNVKSNQNQMLVVSEDDLFLPTIVLLLLKKGR
jgi:protein transport protein SEC24